VVLAGRVPIQLTPQQTFVVAFLGGLVLVALVGGLLLETLVGGGIAAVLGMMGVRKPTKSRARLAIDELEARVQGGADPRTPNSPR